MGVPVFASMQMVPLDGKADPAMESLCRGLALVNAAAFFLESLRGAYAQPDHKRLEFVQLCIATHAENVRVITDADVKRTRADVELLAHTLHIDLTNVAMPAGEEQVH